MGQPGGGLREVGPPLGMAGLLALLLAASAAARPHSTAQYTLISVLDVFLAAWATIAVHEAGHVLAGKAAGFRFARLAVGPLWIERGPGRLRLALNRNWRLVGLAVSVPPDDHRLRQRQMLFMAGGPLANLGFGIVCLGLQDLRGGPIQSWTFEARLCSPLSLGAQHFLYFAGGLSLCMLVINLLPGKAAGYWTDGTWLAALRANSPQAAQASQRLALTSRLMAGQALRHFSVEQVQRAVDAALDRRGVERKGRDSSGDQL